MNTIPDYTNHFAVGGDVAINIRDMIADKLLTLINKCEEDAIKGFVEWVKLEPDIFYKQPTMQEFLTTKMQSYLLEKGSK